MTRILIVEDDYEIAAFVRLGLEVEGYVPEVAHDAATMRAKLQRDDYSLLVLDWMLPDAQGDAVCRELRQHRPQLLILMLTARDMLDQKIEGLRAGADDYMTKPFAFAELVVRIEALLRRARSGAPPEPIRLGDLVIDPALKRATRAGTDLLLSPTEFALLRFLAENRGRIVSRMEILAGVWGKDYDPNTNIVEVYIAYLRRKVEQPGRPRLIQNIRGFGYTVAADGAPSG
jgi:DNA-binding response OmpR family regulator